MSDSDQVILVEDELRTSAAIELLLHAAGFPHVAVFDTALSAAAAIAKGHPTMVLVDLGLPDLDGVDLIHRLRLGGYRAHILAVTSVTSDERILAALRAGADGYLFKSELDVRLAAALRELSSGGAPLSPGAARTLVRAVQCDQPDAGCPHLTVKEQNVLELLSSGASYAEIGDNLRVQLNTVRTHIRSLYEKLGVENRAEAVNLGWRLGVLHRTQK
jgi:DNA-binding NarL/FixJ family response regulator